jgi:hypothetical protein
MILLAIVIPLMLVEKPSHTTEILREAGRQCMTMRYPACWPQVAPEAGK